MENHEINQAQDGNDGEAFVSPSADKSTRRGFLFGLLGGLAGLAALAARSKTALTGRPDAEPAPGRAGKPIDNIFTALRTPKPGYIRRK